MPPIKCNSAITRIGLKSAVYSVRTYPGSWELHVPQFIMFSPLSQYMEMKESSIDNSSQSTS